MSDLTTDSLEQVKRFAPWRTNLPWWVVLIEGVVMGIVGILVLLDPQQTSVNVALFLTIVLIISGVLQLWSALRDKVTPEAESLVTARGSIALFSGIVIWILLYMNALTPDVGRIIFGLGSLTYGLLGIGVVFNTEGNQRRTTMIESIFFTIIGLLMVYVLFAGPDAIVVATRIVGWAALLAGLALIGLAFVRWRDKKQAEETVDQVSGAIEEQADAINAAVESVQTDESWDEMDATIENISNTATKAADSAADAAASAGADKPVS
jgi:uncharacterized membrane protein HdeD (DUF308 family)